MDESLSDDEQDAVIIHEAAVAIGEWLEAAPRMADRRVFSLSFDELKCLAVAAIGQAAITRARLVSQERDLSLVGSILA